MVQQNGRKKNILGRSIRESFFFLPVVKFIMTVPKKFGILIVVTRMYVQIYYSKYKNEVRFYMEKALKIKIFISTIVICGVIVALAMALVDKYTPSETMRTLDNYYAVAPDEAVVLLENEIYGERALLRDGGIYLTLDTVDSILNDAFYLDEAERLLSYTLPEEIIRVEEGQAFYYSNKEKIQ